MSIQFQCASCQALLGIPDEKAGLVVTCPRCRGQMQVPHASPPLTLPVRQPPAVQPSGVRQRRDSRPVQSVVPQVVSRFSIVEDERQPETPPETEAARSAWKVLTVLTGMVAATIIPVVFLAYLVWHATEPPAQRAKQLVRIAVVPGNSQPDPVASIVAPKEQSQVKAPEKPPPPDATVLADDNADDDTDRLNLMTH